MVDSQGRYVMVDLFSGTGSASDPAIARGWVVERVDLLGGQDVREWKPYPGIDLLWASPPCECFSVASMGAHWTGGAKEYIPKDAATRMAIDLVKVTLAKIEAANPRFWIMENPVGMLRKIIGKPTDTTWWCQWGDERAKPTDLWGRFPPGMLPLPKCHNGGTDHASAPRGSKTGTQGRKGSLERARIPNRFMEQVIIATEGVIKRYPHRVRNLSDGW